MTRVALAALLTSVLWVAFEADPAQADCVLVQVTTSYAVIGGFATETETIEKCDDATPVTEEDTSTQECLDRATQLGQEPEFCVDAQQAQASDPAITPGIVLAAFARIPLRPSNLVIQPPNGRTMVNFETNFYTVNEPFTRVVRLLGQRIELRIFPTAFTWRFDDGEPVTTSSPGAPYPDLEVTHNYLATGRFAPSVDTTYSADWRVGSGGWQRVPGTVTIPGASVALEAVEVDLKLVY